MTRLVTRESINYKKTDFGLPPSPPSQVSPDSHVRARVARDRLVVLHTTPAGTLSFADGAGLYDGVFNIYYKRTSLFVLATVSLIPCTFVPI